MSKKRQTNEIPAKTKLEAFLNTSAQSSFNLMFELQSYDEILDPSVEQLLNADLCYRPRNLTNYFHRSHIETKNDQ